MVPLYDMEPESIPEAFPPVVVSVVMSAGLFGVRLIAVGDRIRGKRGHYTNLVFLVCAVLSIIGLSYEWSLLS